jgi:hypothetical protein
MAQQAISSYMTPMGRMFINNEVKKLIFQKILIRSSTYAIAAYFISLIAERLLIFCAAGIRGFTVVLMPDTVKVIAPISEWDQDSVLLIYLMPFFLLTITFIWLNIRFIRLEFITKFSKMFILWMMFFIVFRVLGLLPAHIIFRTGIDYILSWLYLGSVFKGIAVLISLLIFFITGYKLFRGILTISGTYYYHSRLLGMNRLILSSIILPITAVAALSALFYLPVPGNEELFGFGLVVILLVHFTLKMSRLNPKHLGFNENVEEKGSPMWFFILTFFTLVILRIVFEMKLKI